MPWLGSQCSMGSMLRAPVHDTSIGGLMIRRGRASACGCTFIGHLFFWPTVLEESV